MIELSIQEIKQKAFDILLDVTTICERNNIDYYLAYGTLLGAIRHEGFIPWDDDIDIWIPICQYEKFVQAVKEESKYHPIDYVNDKNCTDFWLKIEDPNTLVIDNHMRKNQERETLRGLSIDVFPLFEVEDDPKVYKRIKQMFFKYKIMYQYYMGRSSCKLKPLCILLALKGCDHVYYKNKLLHTMETSRGDYYRIIGPNCSERFLYPKENFKTKTKMKFENTYFDAPAQYDAILKQQYGDYMTPPMESEQVRKHTVSIYHVNYSDRKNVLTKHIQKR